jgi:hypothetical protein
MPPDLRPKKKEEEETGYPKGWALVSNPGEAYNFMRGLWDSPTDVFRWGIPFSRDKLDSLATDAFKLPSQYSKTTVESVKTLVPKTTQELLEKYPPYFVVVPREMFELLRNVEKGSQSGNQAFFIGTDGTFIGIWKSHKSNVAFIRDDVYNKAKNTAGGIEHTLLHETLHYAQSLSNQGSTLYENKGLHEGITEYLAAKTMHQKGHTVSDHSQTYPLEVRIAQALSYIVGEQELRNAYFTDDFSKIKAAVNRLGGFGIWEKIMDPISKPANYDQEKYDKIQSYVDVLVNNAKLDTEKLNRKLKNIGQL